MLIDMATAGYAALALAVLLGTLGAPLPLGVALATMGALARQGHLHLSLLFLCSVCAAVLGDNLGYLAGRYVLRRLPLPSPRGGAAARAARLCTWVSQHGHMGLVVFFTRWSLTTVATPVNLLAGYRRYRWWNFALLDVAGQALWVAITLVPGYWLGATWNWGLGVAAGLILLAGCLCSWLLQHRLARTVRGAPEVVSPPIAIACRQVA